MGRTDIPTAPTASPHTRVQTVGEADLLHDVLIRLATETDVQPRREHAPSLANAAAGLHGSNHFLQLPFLLVKHLQLPPPNYGSGPLLSNTAAIPAPPNAHPGTTLARAHLGH